MAWYDDKANTGYGGVFFDTEGREHAVVGYAKAHNYVATSEQVFEYRKGIGMIEPHEGHGIRDESILMPRRKFSVDDRPHKDDAFSSKVHDHVGYGQNSKGLPQNRDANDPSRLAFYDQSKGWPRNRDASDPSQLGAYDQNKGSPRNRDASNLSRFGVYDQNKGSHWNRDASDASRPAVYDQTKGSPQSRDVSDLSRLVPHGQNKGLPRSKDAYESNRFMSPPSKDHYHNTREIGKNNEFSDDEDDVICKDGVCYPRGGSKPINHLKQEDYDKEKHKGNSYAPKNDSYYEKPVGTNDKHKGNSHVPSSYTVPVTIPQRKDPYSEPSTHNNNRPIGNGPRPIQTRPGLEFPNENTRNSPVSIKMQLPQYDGSPRKDHGYDQSIYNKASPPAGAYAGDKRITIDAKKAAEKYKGVLLTN